MAGLVPGVVTGRLDVGGTEGMQHKRRSFRVSRQSEVVLD